MRSAITILMFHTKAIMHLLQIAYVQLWRKNGDTKGYKGSSMMQAL